MFEQNPYYICTAASAVIPEIVRLSKVAVIIVNYCTAKLVVECLASIASELPDTAASVYVVDNNSPDSSADAIAQSIAERSWHPWCSLIRLTTNHGFSSGTNAGISQALQREQRQDFILLLNPDTAVRAGAIQSMCRFLEQNPTVGIVGSRLEDADGSPQASAFRFPCVLGEFENGIRLGLVTRMLQRFVVALPPSETAHVADWVSGASMMIRREVIDQIGMFDEEYFLYFEEVDFCRRARAAGWSCWYIPESRVIHIGGQSTASTNLASSRHPMYNHWLASRQRYFGKYHSRIVHSLADIMWASGFAMWRARRRWQNKPDTDPPGLLRDFVRSSVGSSSLRHG